MHYGMVWDEKEKKKQQSFSRSFQIIIVKQLSNESVNISKQTDKYMGHESSVFEAKARSYIICLKKKSRKELRESNTANRSLRKI